MFQVLLFIYCFHFRQILLYYFRKGKNAVQAQKKLYDVYGEKSLTERHCQNWFAHFRSCSCSCLNRPDHHLIVPYPVISPFDTALSCRITFAKSYVFLFLCLQAVIAVISYLASKLLPGFILTP